MGCKCVAVVEPVLQLVFPWVNFVFLLVLIRYTKLPNYQIIEMNVSDEPLEDPKHHIGEYFTPYIVLKYIHQLYTRYYPGYTVVEPCCGSGRIVKFFTEHNIATIGYDLYESNVRYCQSIGLPVLQGDYHDVKLESQGEPGVTPGYVIVTNPPYDIPVTKVFHKTMYIDIFTVFNEYPMILLLPMRSLKHLPWSRVQCIELLPPHLFPARIMGNTGLFVIGPGDTNTLEIIQPSSATPGMNNSYFRKLELPDVSTWKPWDTKSHTVNKSVFKGLHFPILRDYSVLKLLQCVKGYPLIKDRYTVLAQDYFTDSVDYHLVPRAKVKDTEIEILVSRLQWNRNPDFIPDADFIHSHCYCISRNCVKHTDEQNSQWTVVVSACNECWNGFYHPIEAMVLPKGIVYSRSYIGIKCTSQSEATKLCSWLKSKLFGCILSTSKQNQNMRTPLKQMVDMSEAMDIVVKLEAEPWIQNWPTEQRHRYNKANLVTFEQMIQGRNLD